MTKTLLLVTILLISIGLKGHAQDIHFSQFWNSPLLQNPSFAGKIDGEMRAIINHRSQWGGVTSNPYKTFGAHFDMRFDQSSKDNYFAGGITMYTDVAGASKMRTTMANLTATYHLKINDRSYISAGLQGGINQKNINEDDLRFDNQFDGFGHNPGINSNEDLTSLSELKPSVSAGISYMWSNHFTRTTASRGGKKKSLNIGLAVHHLNSPNYQFSNPEKLGFKYIANFEATFKINSRLTIQPATFLGLQNQATDFVFGSLFNYALKKASHITNYNQSASIGFGGYFRYGDAVIPTVQIQWASFELGLSYDVNLSQLTQASNGRGGFEISLKYIPQRSAHGRRSSASSF